MAAHVEERPDSGAQPPRRGTGRERSASAGWLVVAIALILAGAGAILVSTAFDTPEEARTLGANLPVNDSAVNALDLSATNSPALVQSPADPDNLAVAGRVDSPEYGCSLQVSFDGGGRWAQTPIPAPADRSAGTRCYAPDAAFAADGTLYITYVTLKGRANSPEAAWIVRSRDGGETLSNPVRTPLPPHAFQLRLAADPTSRNRLYLTYVQAGELGLYQFAGTGNPIQAIRSDDGGQKWSSPSRVSSPDRERPVAPTPVVGPDGELYVLYLDLGDDSLDYAGAHRGRGGPPYDGKWQLVLSRSTDRGKSWEESVVDPGIVPTERFIVFTPPYPSLAVDGDSGRLYASFQDGRNGSADVLLWSLGEGDEKWSKPLQVNDTPRGDRTGQYLPKLAVAPNGRLDVAYYDRRADHANVLNEVSFQSSYDAGESFGPRLRLSDRAFSSRIGFGLERGLADLGSRLGLLSADTRAYAVWTDTRGGSVRTAKQDIARAVVAFSEPARLSDAATWLLRIGGVLLILLGVVIAIALGRRRPAEPAGPEPTAA
ncbi:MAG TPA: hypothetical protein VFN44_23695 [Solirubrobacteraceae bacterium]|nr:hypothetical protein [Solirubrobacteraceae bacterium]